MHPSPVLSVFLFILAYRPPTIRSTTKPTMTKITSYSRPGVETAVSLVALRDSPGVWEKVVEKYNVMLFKKGGKSLVEKDRFCERLGEKLRGAEVRSVSKEELVKVIEWKFAKGKPRPYMKHILANTNGHVQDWSNAAFLEADNNHVEEAIDALTNLKGMGPAGASAVLSLYRPDVFVFMDDEVIECLYSGKRGYTKAIYLEVNNECTKLANDLGEAWTPRRVGMALWTAARRRAGGENEDSILDSVIQADNGSKRNAKRIKRS